LVRVIQLDGGSGGRSARIHPNDEAAEDSRFFVGDAVERVDHLSRLGREQSASVVENLSLEQRGLGGWGNTNARQLRTQRVLVVALLLFFTRHCCFYLFLKKKYKSPIKHTRVLFFLSALF